MIEPHSFLSALRKAKIKFVTGVPDSGQINYSFNDVIRIGGGLYQMPLSIQIEDIYTNLLNLIYLEYTSYHFMNIISYHN